MALKTKIRIIWTTLGVLTIIILWITRNNPLWLERFYGQGVYLAVRWVFSHSISLLPFPAIIIMIGFLLWRVYVSMVVPVRKNESSLRGFLLGLTATLGCIIFWFYALWGFNYRRAGVPERLQLQAVPLDSSALAQEFARASTELFRMAKQLRTGNPDQLSSQLDRRLNKELRAVLKEIGYRTSAPPRGRIVRPRGILLRFNTAGIYVPYVGEGHVDGGLLNVQIPFVMAHELAHGHGITGEGDCNFVAYLACSRSNDPAIRYSGLLSYWRYVAADYQRNWPERYAAVYENDFPDVVKESLSAIYENNKKYPDILPELRNSIYDSYLKSNGIDEGVMSYSRIVHLVYAYEANRD